jgi:protein-tyrosine phosphatase
MFFSRKTPSTRLLMVCMGNICRSPMAQFVTQHLASQAGIGPTILVESAGTHAGGGGPLIDPRAKAALAKRAYPVGKGRARQVVQQDFARFDLVLAMDQSNMNDLREMCPADHSHKLRLFLEFADGTPTLDIPDPYYGSVAGFERVLDLCEAGARGLIAHLKTLPG